MMKKADFYFVLREKEIPYNYLVKFIVEWHHTIVYVGVFYLIFTTLFFEGYQIPSQSMYPTLNGDKRMFVGDRIFAMKSIYRLSPLERGDIVIFISVEDNETFIVKRLVAFPGETVQIKEDGLYINDERVEQPEIFQEIKHNLPFMAPGYSLGARIPWEAREKHYSITHGRMPLHGWATKHPLEVPKDSYLVLGDNTDHSNDGRMWGYLPKERLLGKATLIWWPIQRASILR